MSGIEGAGERGVVEEGIGTAERWSGRHKGASVAR